MNSHNSGDTEINNQNNKDLASVCGLYCGACGIYLATRENDSEKILQYAVVLNQTFEETLCDGCGAKRKSSHCSKMCIFINCKLQKKVDFCSECEEFPCRALHEFKSKMPHRIEIIDAQNRMKEIGIENWLLEMKDNFSCPQCKTINTAYDLTCRKCLFTPSCKFVDRHKNIIDKHMTKE